MPSDSAANMDPPTRPPSTTTLVLGATGATGKWVVKLLLDQGHKVRVIVRSQERLLSFLQEEGSDTKQLAITEASILDLSDSELQEQIKGCDAVVQCLGHNLNFKGMYGHPRKLVTEAAQRLTSAMKSVSSSKKMKFIMMGSDGVAHPNGKDDKRSFGERLILSILRLLVPPHVDNEAAAAYVHSLGSNENFEWSVIRPTDLVDGKPTGKYELFDKPQGSLFGSGEATRSNVAQCMVDFILEEGKWQQYKFQMPVIHDHAVDKSKSEL